MADLIERYRTANAKWEKSCERHIGDMTDAQFERHMKLMDKADAAYFEAMDKHHPGWRDMPWHMRPSIDGTPKSTMDAYVGNMP